MYRQPYPLLVTIARQECAVSVLVIVEDLELEVARMGHDGDRGLPDHSIGRDPDLGAHAAVGSLLGVPEASSVGDQSTYCRVVCFVQPKLFHRSGKLFGGRHWLDLLSFFSPAHTKVSY